MREWTSRISDTHYCLGSVMEPHPFPTIVGSAIIKLIEKYGADAPKYVAEYVKSMKDAIRS